MIRRSSGVLERRSNISLSSSGVAPCRCAPGCELQTIIVRYKRTPAASKSAEIMGYLVYGGPGN